MHISRINLQFPHCTIYPREYATLFGSKPTYTVATFDSILFTKRLYPITQPLRVSEIARILCSNSSSSSSTSAPPNVNKFQQPLPMTKEKKEDSCTHTLHIGELRNPMVDAAAQALINMVQFTCCCSIFCAGDRSSLYLYAHRLQNESIARGI